MKRAGSALTTLAEEVLANVEEDYQVCVRMLTRAGSAGARNKPKRGRNPHSLFSLMNGLSANVESAIFGEDYA